MWQLWIRSSHLVFWNLFVEVGPASMIVGNLVAGKRIAQASGRELAHLEDSDQARKVLCSSRGGAGGIQDTVEELNHPLCAVSVPGGCAAVASSYHTWPPAVLAAERQGKCRTLGVFPVCHFQVFLFFVGTIERY